MKKTIDMTVGNPIKLILVFALPIFAGNLFQLFYSLADTMVVGYAMGDDGIAAVGATSAITSLIISFAMGMTNGFSLVVSRFFGAKDEKRLKNAVAGTYMLTVIISVVVTALSLVFASSLLKMLNTPDKIFQTALAYISVVLGGMSASMFYNMFSGLLRALGNSVAALIILISSVIMNIGLDLLLVFPLGMGIVGAALATVIAQIISVILTYIYIRKRFPILKISRKDFDGVKVIIPEMLTSGFSMAFMFSIVSIGTLVLQGAINGLGTAIITAHTAARRIGEIFMLPISTLAGASATYSSQNFGAGKISRISKGTLRIILLSWIWSSFSVIVIYLFAPFITQLVTDTKDKTVIDTAVTYLRINLPFYFVLGILVIMRSSLQGFGKKIVPLIASALELFGKIFAVTILTPRLGYMGVCITEPIIWIVCSLFLLAVFFGSKEIRQSLKEKL